MSTDKGVRVWLRRHGAEQIAHPGGNLYAHLGRVGERLAVPGCSSEVRAASLPLASEQVIRDVQGVLRP
ncbi:DUF6817 domain-containing protein [Micromonospora sp. NPDC002717]|uniref:DUF6817 domain-containing protein n=1 Tax=Micromonospora sp. NPDC002717 TaxID=3154424 RepID=UPI00333385C2